MTDRYLMNNYGPRTITLQRGQGAYLFDAEGKKYLDFTAGIAVCNLGHAHPAVTQAITEQASALIHCSNLYLNAEQNRLSARLTALAGLDRAFFCNSGTEANEAALKLARKYAVHRNEPNRTQILSLPGGFHGRTYGSLSMTGKSAYQEGFHPLVPDCLTPSDMDQVISAINEKTAAVIVEVVQGEGGVHVVDGTFLREIEQRCKSAGALFIVDEIQTGVGRTGSFLAYEQVGLSPDIVTMAKGLANGVPIGAVLTTEEVAEAFTPGSHGSTFGGNPLATRVANTVVDIIANDPFLQAVQEKGQYLRQKLQALSDDVSGMGLMVGITVPDAKAFVQQAAQKGVLLTAPNAHRVRFVPPLVIEYEQMDLMVERLAALG